MCRHCRAGVYRDIIHGRWSVLAGACHCESKVTCCCWRCGPVRSHARTNDAAQNPYRPAQSVTTCFRWDIKHEFVAVFLAMQASQALLYMLRLFCILSVRRSLRYSRYIHRGPWKGATVFWTNSSVFADGYTSVNRTECSTIFTFSGS